jgi:hypothetical protein
VRLVAAELMKLFNNTFEKIDIQQLKQLSGDALKYVVISPKIGEMPLPAAA